jgi:hypothetical protein
MTAGLAGGQPNSFNGRAKRQLHANEWTGDERARVEALKYTVALAGPCEP